MRKTRKTLTDKGVDALPVNAKRYNFPDPGQAGLYVRVMPTGRKSYAAVAVNSVTKKQIWHVLGACDLLKIEEARARTREVLPRIRAGKPPVAPKSQTFRDVSASWLRDHVDRKKVRSKREIVRIIDRHLMPEWQDREFVSIRRLEIKTMLDKIADSSGLRTADTVLAVIRSICGWHQVWNEDYASPIVRGMRFQAPQARDRILDDNEIREVWAAAGNSGVFGNVVKLCLLTGQRRSKVIGMKWADLTDNGWDIPEEDEREKGTAGLLPLPPMALSIIETQPRTGNPHVFAGRGDGPFNGLSKAKRMLDARIKAARVEADDMLPPWVLHDLRRTARSLLPRAGVSPHTAERVLGHKIPGVAGVYDRHVYSEEKRDALEKLAALIMNIVDPKEPADNVTPLPVRRRKAGR